VILGELLYTDRENSPVPEAEWAGLVRSVAAGDRGALRQLYERTHRMVFTLMVRIANDTHTAEDLTLDVFHDVWRRARSYDVAGGTVVAWIMNQARSRAVERLRVEHRVTREGDAVPAPTAANPKIDFDVRERGRVLRAALAALTPDERQAIEVAYFPGFTYSEVAARLQQPLATVTTRVRSGLEKLRRALATERIPGRATRGHGPEHSDRVLLYALQALPWNEVPAVEEQLSACPDCLRDLATLRPVIATLSAWPTDVLRPSALVWGRLEARIAAEVGGQSAASPPLSWTEPDWAEVAPGISVKLLATDTERERVSMLVRLGPGVDYPPHRHAGLEELHLLDGELMIDEKQLHPGDYNRAEAESVDNRVWSETGCTCVLVTSPGDLLG
jgi:RNA polymerase sigma-70 factor (ECF subfamily)